MPGDFPAFSGPHVRQCRFDAHIGGVGLGGGGQQNDRLRQREPGLRQAQLQGVVHAGLDNQRRLGVGQPHVLAGGAEQPAAGGTPDGGDQVPGLQQAGQVMQGRVRVRAAHGLHQGGGNVKVGVPLPVVAHGGFLGGSLRVRQGDFQKPFPAPGGACQKLQGVHGLPDVPAAGGGDMLLHPLLTVDRRTQPAFQDGQPPLDGGQSFLGGDLLELEHGGP